MFFAASPPPAGGAAVGQIVIATAGAALATAILLHLGLGHRSGRVGFLRRVGAYAERVSGMPAWAAIPGFVVTLSLLVALFGMLWDISLHIADGRDEGPLANPAHYFILAGLFGVFAAGFLAIVLPLDDPGPTAVRITREWRAPVGGVLLAASGGFALIGFPLDDVWHRLFGQDVTLWGPTHLMLIGGAAMSLIALAVLLVEGRRAAQVDPVAEGAGAPAGWLGWLERVSLTGAFLLGLSVFQGEFDFGVPQFRLVFHPMLIMLAAGAGLVAARVWLGAGAALGAAVFFLLVRGLIALIVGPVLGEPTPHFPLFAAEALLVEGVALIVSARRPLAFGAAAGLAIGTLGLAAEWGWSQMMFPNPWPDELLPEGVVLGLAMALAGALLGAWIGERLASDELPRTPALRGAAVVAAVVVAACVGYGLYSSDASDVRAVVTLQEVQGAPERHVAATVRIEPPSAAEDADLVGAIGWQGGGLVVDQLSPTGEPGVYRTTEPLPVYDGWKTLIRLQKGASILGAPVYLPEDPAIPARGVPAEATVHARFHPRARDPSARGEGHVGLAVAGGAERRAGDRAGAAGRVRVGVAPAGRGDGATRRAAFSESSRGPAATARACPSMKTTMRAVVAGVIVSAMLPAGAAADRDDHDHGNRSQPIVIAHRGASGYRPEHTLAAYELGARQGADYIEPDLVSTRDGVLVARHENEISTTTDVAAHPEFAARRATKLIDGVTLTGWFTEDFTLAELKTLRAKERIPAVRPANTAFDGQFPVPTLQEVIDLAQRLSRELGRPIGIYPETKHPTYFDSIGLSLEEPLARVLTRNGLNHRRAKVFVQSFETGNLRQLSRRLKVPLVQLIGGSGAPYDLVAAGDPRTYSDLITPAGLREIARYADGIGPDKARILPRDASRAVAGADRAGERRASRAAARASLHVPAREPVLAVRVPLLGRPERGR